MVTTGLVAIDSTILATAVPTIVGELGGFAQFPLLFSIYLLAQAVSVPVYAKLSDTLGRKPIILVGIGLFLLGSVLCGLAWSMPALIVFRAVQGLGAGAVQPMAVTIAGDIYSVVERAKVQGYIASVWAVSAVVGPTLGGVFSEFLSWRAIFFVNVPLCLLAAVMIVRRLHESVRPQRHRIDFVGAALLTVGMSALILGLLEGGQAWEWASWPGIGSFALAAVALTAFAVVQTRAAEPILPPAVLRRRLILTTTLTSLGVGAMMMGLTSYVPAYLEGALDVSPLVSGLALATLTLGWPTAATVSGRFYGRFGFRFTIMLGTVVALAGAVLLAATAQHPSIAVVAVGCFVIGFGFGLVAAPGLISAQSSVPWNERGVVTGTNLFARSIGSAVGVAVFGAVANGIIGASSGGTTGDPDAAAVIAASAAVFLAIAITGVLLVVAGALVPRVSVRDVSPEVPDPDGPARAA
ncbi:MFS transporter [Herbiconiux moechotypicola]|nr:MFS transporter [Herbiconiux moechotypicola]MCS5728256.1 MFS transporter [Herbiconiux moechotypicola]